MTDYTSYGQDHHIVPRLCPTLNRPATECCCDRCEAERVSPYPSDVESEGGEL